MTTATLPKPHNLRLPVEVEDDVQDMARTLRKQRKVARLPISQVLVALIKTGLQVNKAEQSRTTDLTAILKELDPNWSGKRLREIAPIEVKTRSGKSPVQLLLETRE